jgi:hypothetical protein
LGLQTLDGFEHLLYLISFCHPIIILNIYTWIALPGCFVNPVAAACLPGFTKLVFTYFAQIIKRYAFWVKTQSGENFFNFCHALIIPLLIPKSMSESENGLFENRRGKPQIFCSQLGQNQGDYGQRQGSAKRLTRVETRYYELLR